MLGLNFGAASNFLFAVTFNNCILDFSTFFKKKMKKTKFDTCSMKEVDFEDADLAQSVFNNCDLLDASFVKTNLEKADLRTAYNYSIDPAANKIKKARFSAQGLAGLLAKYDIEIE